MIQFYGADICKDCVAAHPLLKEHGIAYEFIDITASTENLRAFLALRDSRPEFDEIKAEGRIGIPAFVQDDTLVLGIEWIEGESRCESC